MNFYFLLFLKLVFHFLQERRNNVSYLLFEDAFKALAMEYNALITLVTDRNVETNWSTSTVSKLNHFTCALALPTDTILFCFIPVLLSEPYVASIPFHSLQDQCQKQGFLDKSIGQIQKHLRSQTIKLSSGLSFEKKGKIIELSLSISSALKVLLKAEIIDTDGNLSFMLLRRLLDDVLSSSDLLRKQSTSMEKMIDDKDRALSFLRDHLEESYDGQALNRWAPKGSHNYQALEKFENANVKRAIFESSDDTSLDQAEVMEVADVLFTMKRELKDYKKLHPTSPSKKKKAVKMNSDFAPIQESVVFNHKPPENNVNVKFEPTPSLVKSESPVKLESPVSGRDSSESPSRKRKFRKVKISKGSAP